MRLPNPAEARLDTELLTRYVEAMTTTKTYERLTNREMGEALRYAPTDALVGIRTLENVLDQIIRHGGFDEAQDYVEKRFASAVRRNTSTIHDWGLMVRAMRQAVLRNVCGGRDGWGRVWS